MIDRYLSNQYIKCSDLGAQKTEQNTQMTYFLVCVQETKLCIKRQTTYVYVEEE
jgi:hypothetical protein